MSSAKPIRVLIVDDHSDTLDWMKLLLENRGYVAQTATLGAESEQIRDTWQPQIVLMDSKLPDVGGTDLLRRFKESGSSAEVIMITGHGSVSLAVDAMRAGAYSFIEKPVDPDVLLAMMDKALERSVLSQENQRLREQLQQHAGFSNIVSTGARMGRLFQLMSLVAPTDANVLIHGESGTGKELVASAIHEHSKRANGPFVKINCAAVPAELMESELFGHKKGSFTGAVADKVGLVELATGGSPLLGRDRRAGAAASSQTPAAPAGAGIPADRRDENHSRGFPLDLRHECLARCAVAQDPRGFVFPHQHDHARDSAAA
jgi:DNA-binding NtrC family response regulator